MHGISSPLTGFPGHFTRDSSEPNLNYISMKESQTKRDRTMGERLTRSADNLHSDQSDKEFYKEASFVERARRQREIDEETAAQFNGLSVPARSTSARPQTPPEQPIDPDKIMPEPIASEEETEQEEDVVVQVPRSQEAPPSSMEEDKENYDGPMDTITASAHDRLSQVLGFQQIASPSRECFNEESDDGLGEQGLHASHISGQPNEPVRSSQAMVKDSQPSPQSSPKRIDPIYIEPITNSPTLPYSRMAFPPKERLQSSPPFSRPASRLSYNNTQSNGFIPTEHIEEHSKSVSLTTNEDTHASNLQEQHNTNPSRSEEDAGPEDNSSSLPYQVAQTPAHQRLKQVGDMAFLPSIQETSPSNSHYETGSNGFGMNNEDDDLPLMFNGTPTNQSSHRWSNIRPTGARALSSPLKKLLSSPGGGQRRALTEIAADLSPQVGTGGFDMGIGVFTTEDEEFNALVEGSPTRPKKKRKGNNSSSYIASDPIIPFTPRNQPPKSVTPSQSSQFRPAPIPEMSDEVSFVQVPQTIIRRQPRPPRRVVDNIWEIEGSPEQPVRRRSRIGKQTTSRSLQAKHVPERSSGLTEKPAPMSAPPHSPKVVVHNPPVSLSSELIEVSSIIASDDIIDSDGNPTKQPPTTPQKPHTSSDDATYIAPSQVIAVWRGQKRAYYPATCFGTPLGVSKDQFSVKFEDSNAVEVPKGAVKRFELRIGDGVKIDMPHVPKVTHVVRGFDDKLTREELAKAISDGLFPVTDIYGHSSVIVGPKQRKSLPNGGLGNTENVIKVPMARIYLDTILWNQLKDRAFTHHPAPVQQEKQESTVHTPSEKLSAPVSPSARLSRSIHHDNGMFAGMAFAVSYKEDETLKNRITRLIMENGGTILHEGFTELFESSSIVPIDTPTKANAQDTYPDNKGLQLTALAEGVGFTCLIADTHSRREKYMQALALNLPCLSGRWVEDCIAKGRVTDWDIYLLPAGDSTYLNGATKSRLMLPTPPSTARLPETIASRPKLLAGHSVLLVMGRGKAEEKRKAYIFLTYALGASRVERVTDLGTAKALIDSQSDAGLPASWDWIYVDDADQKAAKSMLTPKPKMQRIHLFHGKKRKKSIASSTPTPPNELRCSAKVVGNEFLCQSLILGRLYEE